MTNIELKNWLKLSLLSLLWVGMLGILMRYKIIFELPIFDQKHLQHAHSHFAFSGWISQTLMVFMIWFLHNQNITQNAKSYKTILTVNLVLAYGMLGSFMLFGYNWLSIFFSTASIFTSFAFSYLFYFDTQKLQNKTISTKWFNAALLFNIISSLGTFVLAYMMATKHLHQHLYLAAVYWYLHFQYNGWFFFACIGLLLHEVKIIPQDDKHQNILFWLFFISCFPAYMLSILWINLPIVLFIITALAAFIQVFAWAKFIIHFKKYFSAIKQKTHKHISLIIILLCLSISVKFLLQLGSNIPSVSKLAFGFRPIVIAYLHLVLLAIISVFLVYYMHLKGLFDNVKNAVRFTLLLILGIYLNELVLGLQGIASFAYILVPFAQQILLLIAVFMVFYIFKLLYITIKSK
jgi:hypothetical protein